MTFAKNIERPDTCTSISYLTTRVIDPDQSNWLKMVHLFKYVRGNKYLLLILIAYKIVMLNWYIDGSHVVHPNIRGDTGVKLKMGRGFPISVSSKQKLNTRSSTKSEIVGVDQLIPSVLWTRIF